MGSRNACANWSFLGIGSQEAPKGLPGGPQGVPGSFLESCLTLFLCFLVSLLKLVLNHLLSILKLSWIISSGSLRNPDPKIAASSQPKPQGELPACQPLPGSIAPPPGTTGSFRACKMPSWLCSGHWQRVGERPLSNGPQNGSNGAQGWSQGPERSPGAGDKACRDAPPFSNWGGLPSWVSGGAEPPQDCLFGCPFWGQAPRVVLSAKKNLRSAVPPKFKV